MVRFGLGPGFGPGPAPGPGSGFPSGQARRYMRERYYSGNFSLQGGPSQGGPEGHGSGDMSLVSTPSGATTLRPGCTKQDLNVNDIESIVC